MKTNINCCQEPGYRKAALDIFIHQPITSRPVFPLRSGQQPYMRGTTIQSQHGFNQELEL